MTDFAVIQNNSKNVVQNNRPIFKNFTVPDSYNYTSSQQPYSTFKNDIQNNNSNKKKYIKCGIITAALLGVSALGYVIGIRKFESKFFKDIAKTVRSEELSEELKKFTKELTLTSKKGNKINVWDINQGNYTKYIVKCNGIDAGKNAQDFILKQANEHNYGFIEFDYCGLGKSTGTFGQSGCYESLDTVMNYLKEKGIASEDIVLVGHSMGTGVACDYAKRNAVRGVVLVEPFDKFVNTVKVNVLNIDNLPKFIKKTIQIFPNWLIPIKNKLNNVKALKEIKCPTLIITAKDDTVVPYNLSKTLYEKTKNIGRKEIVELEKGGHLFTEDKERASFEFIDKLFG